MHEMLKPILFRKDKKNISNCRLLIFLPRMQSLCVITFYTSGLSCSKLTMSLVNDSLKFTSSDTQIC